MAKEIRILEKIPFPFKEKNVSFIDNKETIANSIEESAIEMCTVGKK